MTIRAIRITGDPVLHTPARPVTDFGDDLATLVSDMIETMREAPGVGLAAPQIGVAKQVFVWEWEDDSQVLHEGAIVNPSLWRSRPRGKLDEDADSEGCLSVPDFRYPTRRSEKVVLTGLSPSREPLRIDAHGWLARIFQHEWDHLQGDLYIDRLGFRLRREARADIREAGWGKPGLAWVPGVDDFENSDHQTEET